MAKPTERDIVALIEQLGRARPKRPAGTGWFTLEQMAKRRGMSVAAWRYRFNVALRNGLRIEQATGSDYDGEGKLRRVIYYREKR